MTELSKDVGSIRLTTTYQREE